MGAQASPGVCRAQVQAGRQAYVGVLEIPHHAPEVVRGDTDVCVTRHVLVVVRDGVQSLERVNLGVMEARCRLATGDVTRTDLRVALPGTPRELQSLITIVPCAKQEFEIGVVLLEKGLEVALQTGLRPVQRLQHTHGWQVTTGLTLLAPAAHAKSNG